MAEKTTLGELLGWGEYAGKTGVTSGDPFYSGGGSGRSGYLPTGKTYVSGKYIMEIYQNPQGYTKLVNVGLAAAEPTPEPTLAVGEGAGEGGIGGVGEYPELELPRYEAYAGLYPYTKMPTYEPFQVPYPMLELPRYEAFPTAYPELGPLYGEAEDVIGRMLRGEGLGLPIEELMGAYTEEERLAMEKYMPELREYWAGKDLLRSGMEREAERGAVERAGAARGTYRAQLEKESVIRTQEGVVTALNLAATYTGMGYEAQRDAWQAAMSEYTKVYQYEIAQGIAEYEADARGWEAAMSEYTKVFASNVSATTFGQAIQERAFSAGRDEYQRVYQSLFQATGDEYGAQTQAFEAAWREMDTVRQMEFQKWMVEFQAELQVKLAEMGLSAQQTQSIWGAIGTIFGGALAGPIGGALTGWLFK